MSITDGSITSVVVFLGQWEDRQGMMLEADAYPKRRGRNDGEHTAATEGLGPPILGQVELNYLNFVDYVLISTP
eukprot:scaffold80508_cov60-Attheya_sp.AAC.7